MSFDHTTKRCPKCGVEYPLTPDFWSKSSRNKNGYGDCCKTCNNNRNKLYREEHPEKYKDSKRKWAEQNPELLRQIKRKWQLEHPQNAIIATKKYLENNADKVKQWRKRWYKNNQPHIKAYREEYKAKNHEKMKAKWRQYHRDNLPKVLAKNRKRRARKLNAEGDYTFSEVMILFREQSGYCFHCGVDLIPIGFHCDHWIPLSKGGSNWISNIRLMCPNCNLSKGAKLPCEWDKRYCD